MTNRSGLFGFFAVALLATGASVASAQTWSLDGNAQLVDDAGPAVEIVSAQGHPWPDPLSGGSYHFNPPAPFTFGDLTELSVDYKANFAIGGSPRFVVRVQHPTLGVRNIEVNFGGDPGSFKDLTPMTNYESSGNAIGMTENRWEIGPEDNAGNYNVVSGQYGNYAQAVQVIPASSPVLRIYIVVDSGWSNNGDEIVLFKNFKIVANGQTYVGNGKFVIDTRNQTTIDGLNDAVESAHVAAALVPAGTYATYAKAAEASAYAAHQNSKTVTYIDDSDLPAALVVYKAYRYQQYKYHLRAAQYFHYATGGTDAKAFSQTAGQLGNADYNAP